MKLVWIFLCCSLFLGFFAIFQYSESREAITNVSLNSYETELFKRINDERLKIGEKELVVDKKLTEAAKKKSLDLKENNYFQHNSQRLGSPKEMLDSSGVIFYRLGGENLAKGKCNVDSIVDAWLNSEGHSYNIFESKYKRTGIGVERGEDGFIYCTQIFLG